MVTINSISPKYSITKDGDREILSYEVDFKVTKKIASSGDSVSLSGILVIPAEDITFIESISRKITNNLQNLLT